MLKIYIHVLEDYCRVIQLLKIFAQIPLTIIKDGTMYKTTNSDI